MKKKKTGALKRKMLFGMLLILIPVLAVVTVLFWQTRSALKEEYIRTAHHDLKEVSRNIDEKVDEVYAMSDVYAGIDELEDYAETVYSKRKPTYKKGAIVRIHEEILEPIDRLNRREKLSAMYTWQGEMLNFRDPNQDTEETKHELEKMQVNDPANLMRFIWYPVRENFLLSDMPEDIHEKMAVFASRRVFSREHNRYEYVQIFALDEGVFYDLYKDKAKVLRGEIYIIDREGNVISSSDEETLKAGKIPQVHELYSLKILLQPIVENSFLYGTEGLERPMKVRLSIHERDGWVWIRVVDNGCGMDKERLAQVRSQIKKGRKNTEEKAPRSTGIGLHSAQMRIRLYFGIEDAVSIYSKKGMGTLVVVKIPVITKEDVDESGNLKEKQK